MEEPSAQFEGVGTEILMFFDENAFPTIYRWRVKGPGGDTVDCSRIPFMTRAACIRDMYALKARRYPEARIIDATYSRSIIELD